jgi:hypothetical protein
MHVSTHAHSRARTLSMNIHHGNFILCNTVLSSFLQVDDEFIGLNGRMVRGGHGLSKVSLGPTLPYPSTLCGWAPLRPYGCFRGGPSAEWAAFSRFLPPWTPHAVRLWEWLIVLAFLFSFNVCFFQDFWDFHRLLAWGFQGVRRWPCRRASPETAIRPFQGWPVHRA